MRNEIFALILFTVCILTACSSVPGDLDELVDQVEQALPEEYEKYMQTDVYDYVFGDEEGNKIIQHVCLTTFFAADPEDVTGLHTQAFQSVFDVKNTPILKEFEATGHPAAIYQGENCHYICCTISPEASVVLEYDPEDVSEQEAILMIRSIFEGPDVAKELEP